MEKFISLLEQMLRLLSVCRWLTLSAECNVSVEINLVSTQKLQKIIFEILTKM